MDTDQKFVIGQDPGPEQLKNYDPEIYTLIQNEKARQCYGIELIASENFVSHNVLAANGSPFTNKYSEGVPGKRYYGGTHVVDNLELLCEKRALQAFGLDPKIWGVNVQPYSGSPANFAVLNALLPVHGRFMGLLLTDGGHLTHGFQTATKKISSTTKFFESLSYRIDPATGLIDYDALEKMAQLYNPRVIIIGASAYPRDYDYARFRKIADSIGAYLFCDMAHTAGLIAGKVLKSPFHPSAEDPNLFCDIVTTTTHKTLRGPRGALIFYRKGSRQYTNSRGKLVTVDYENFENSKSSLRSLINDSVFPGLQGGPHNNTIAAIAVALKEACSSDFQQYAAQVQKNCRALAEHLTSNGHTLISNGTDNHLILWDLKPSGVTGSKMEKLCDAICISINKNTVPGDKSALNPGGVRIGASAFTSRGANEEDFVEIAKFLCRGVAICQNIIKKHGVALKSFIPALESDPDIPALRKDVIEWSKKFKIPGFSFDNHLETTYFQNEH